MAATQRLEGVAAAIDRVIEYFNARKLDLPDGLFDRKTQFVINGAPFETLLGRSPDDPLILMLARGPAGYRFTIKALQHAMPDVRIARAGVQNAGDSRIDVELRLSGKLRGSGEAIDVAVPIALTLATAGQVEIADASIDGGVLDKIRQARLIA